MRTINWIVLHTAAAVDKQMNAVHQSVDVIRRYHQEHNGWRDIGYHWYVEREGIGRRGRDEGTMGAHVRGFNSHSLGLCVSGHGDYEAWNLAQRSEVVRKCVEWCKAFKLTCDEVVGHCEADEHGAPDVHKTCPGRLIDLVGLRAMISEALMESPGPQMLEERVAELERRVRELEG